MSNFRSEDSSFRRATFVAALAVMGVAAVVYALTLATYVFPGDSARHLVQWTGVDTLDFPEFPLWGFFVRSLSTLAVVVTPSTFTLIFLLTKSPPRFLLILLQYQMIMHLVLILKN